MAVRHPWGQTSMWWAVFPGPCRLCRNLPLLIPEACPSQGTARWVDTPGAALGSEGWQPELRDRREHAGARAAWVLMGGQQEAHGGWQFGARSLFRCLGVRSRLCFSELCNFTCAWPGVARDTHLPLAWQGPSRPLASPDSPYPQSWCPGDHVCFCLSAPAAAEPGA